MLTKCNTSAIFCVGNPAGSDDSHLRSIFCDTIGLYVKALRTVHTTDDGTTIESCRQLAHRAQNNKRALYSVHVVSRLLCRGNVLVHNTWCSLPAVDQLFDCFRRITD